LFLLINTSSEALLYNMKAFQGSEVKKTGYVVFYLKSETDS